MLHPTNVRSLPVLVVVLVGSLLVFQLASRLGSDDPVAVHGDDRERPLSAAVADFRPDEIVQVLPPDAIPAIVAPELVAAADAGDLEDDELVIGVRIEREARAYPIRVLSAHEIANDEIHGRPIVVTW